MGQGAIPQVAERQCGTEVHGPMYAYPWPECPVSDLDTARRGLERTQAEW